MVKTSFPLILLFLSFGSFAQNNIMKGKFTGENLEKSFINIININQAKATISQLDGNFEIQAREGDSILISSIQYKEIKFVVKPEYFEELIEIELHLKVNELSQVDLYSIGLTGNLTTDAENIRTEDSSIMNISRSDIANAYDENVETQAVFTHRNVAMEQNSIPASVDFIKVFSLMGRLFKKNKKKNNSETEYKYQRSRLDDIDFLINVLEIKEDDVGHFLDYAESKGISKTMLKPSNELDLIEFLIKISKEFKAEYEK